MVNIGDTVLVTIPTFLPTGFGAAQRLQNRLQQAGFQVIRVNDSGLPFLGVISGRGSLLVTVVPRTSSYSNVQDVASLVAGAAYAEGYDINAGANGQVVAFAGAGSQGYQNLQNQPPAAAPFDFSSIPTSWLVLGGATLAVLLFLKR